tara:strand:- start:1724 stop:1945 length:222 start_codon:yes stop_codon:yes gene_type:complete
MNKTELNQKFEALNRECNALWDSSKSLQEQSEAWRKAWKARFEVSRELRNFRELGGSRSRCHDMAFKIREQNA